MRNPFDDLGKPRVEQPQGEEIEGTLFCQERGCHEVCTTGRYIKEASVLTWQCREGHISKMEGFRWET